MKKGKRIYISNEVKNAATPKQLDYIDGLLSKKKCNDFDTKLNGDRLGIKQASNMIDCLLKNKKFQIVDINKLSKIKQEILNAKYKAKVEEREKIAKIKNLPVTKNSDWKPSKPKTFDSTPKISLAEQQAKLKKLEEEYDNDYFQLDEY